MGPALHIITEQDGGRGLRFPECSSQSALPRRAPGICRGELCPAVRFLDVSIEMPEELDISQLRSTGLQPGEEELPDIAPPLVTPDEPKGSLGFYGNEDEDSFCSPHFSSPTC